MASFSNIQSSWADQYGSIDTWNIKIRSLMTILWPNILGHQQGALNSLLTTIPNRNYRSDRPGGLILYCTALFCTVLYKKRRMRRRKMRKFADRQTENSSKTDATLILCGSSGERANILYFYTVEYFYRVGVISSLFEWEKLLL